MPMKRFKQSKQHGFTLIEIVIAMMVISVALGAIISTTGNSVNHATHIQNKTLALWVAENYLAEVSIKDDWLPVGEQLHEINMAGQQWFLTNQITQTANKSIRRMDLSVYSDSRYENRLTSLVAYTHKPQVFTELYKSTGSPVPDTNSDASPES